MNDFGSQPQLYQFKDGTLINSSSNQVHLKDYGIDITQGIQLSKVPNSEISSDNESDIDVETNSPSPLLEVMSQGIIPNSLPNSKSTTFTNQTCINSSNIKSISVTKPVAPLPKDNARSTAARKLIPNEDVIFVGKTMDDPLPIMEKKQKRHSRLHGKSCPTTLG